MKVGDLSSRDPDTRLRRFKKRVSFYFHFVLILLGLQQLKPPSQPVSFLGSYLAASSPTNLAVSTFS